MSRQASTAGILDGRSAKDRSFAMRKATLV